MIIPSTLSFMEQAIIAIVSSGGLVTFIALMREVLKRRASAKQDVGYANINRVYTILTKLLTESGCNRVLIIKSENGGGIPAPGSVIKNSVLFEVCDSMVSQLRDDWQHVHIDQGYSSLLTNVNTEGFSDVSREDMNKNSVLFEFFDAGQATQARFYRICSTDKVLIYLGAFYSHGIDLSSKDKISIRACAQELCRIFKKHHSLVKIEGNK